MVVHPLLFVLSVPTLCCRSEHFMLLLKTPPTGSTGLPLPGQSEKSSEGLNWKLVCARGCGEDKADCGEEVDDGKGCIYRKSLERESNGCREAS